MTACRSNRLNESLVGKAQPRRPACSLNHPVYRLYICGVFHLKPHLVHDEKTEVALHYPLRGTTPKPRKRHFFPLSLFMGLHFDVISVRGLYSTFSLYSVLHVFIIPFSPCPRSVYFLFKFLQGLVVYLFYFVESFLRKVIEPFFGFMSSLTASPSNPFYNSQFFAFLETAD